MTRPIVQVTKVQQRILLIRGQKVILDADLAEAYGVTTKALNQAIRRNAQRFPSDFMFRLTKEEKHQVVTNCDHLENLKFSPVNPNAFTEHGAIMAASVLNSSKAIEVSVYVVRAFVHLREAIEGQKEIMRKLDQLQKKTADHDVQITSIIKAIRNLMNPEPPPRTRRIGFKSD